MLTVHGRTRCQFYASRADWAAIGAVKKAVSIPVSRMAIAASLADAASMLAQSGADAVMIGRSAIGGLGSLAMLPITWRRAKPGPKHRQPRAKRGARTFRDFARNIGSRSWRSSCAQTPRCLRRLAGVRDGAAFRQRLVRLECPSAVRVTLCQLFDSPLLIEAA